jgi:hypothetical protein
MVYELTQLNIGDPLGQLTTHLFKMWMRPSLTLNKILKLYSFIFIYSRNQVLNFGICFNKT